MKLRRFAGLLLLLLTVAACGVGVSALAAPWLPPTTPGGDGLGLAELVGAGCALAAVSCWVWWALATVVVAVQALSAAPPSSDRWVRWAPRAVRVLVPVLVGAVVGAGPAGASTEAGPTTNGTPPVRPAAGALVGLEVPDRVPTSGPSHHRVQVRPGDTLWGIAARLLPSSAPAAAVDRGWRRIARANAARLPDPDLIRPGTRLRVPPLNVHPREEAP